MGTKTKTPPLTTKTNTEDITNNPHQNNNPTPHTLTMMEMEDITHLTVLMKTHTMAIKEGVITIAKITILTTMDTEMDMEMGMEMDMDMAIEIIEG